MPFTLLNDWLAQETTLGSPNPNRIVLATAAKDGTPHSRVVAIKEVSNQTLLFFTQHGTRKTLDMRTNPRVSATLWLPLQQRQVIFDGTVIEIPAVENAQHWQALPRETQLKFTAYAPISSQPIRSLTELEEKYAQLAKQFANQDVPLTEFYRGYRLIPEKIFFYTLGVETFSEVFEFQLQAGVWQKQLLSP